MGYLGAYSALAQELTGGMWQPTLTGSASEVAELPSDGEQFCAAAGWNDGAMER